MKQYFLISVFTFICGNQALACSEAGPHDFNIPTQLETKCAQIALKYAKDFANTMVQIEMQQKGYNGPDGRFKPSKATPVLYTTKERNGNSKLIGFNVGLDSKNKWKCNFCIDMSLETDNNCRIASIQKHMCAN